MIETRARSFADLVGFPACLGPALPGETHGTTVIALRFDQGVLVLADRRATAGNLIMYDQAEKVLPLDDHTVVGISGAYGRSLEVCRFLRHSFKFYARMHLQELSFEGKLMEISRALAANQAEAMAGAVNKCCPVTGILDHLARRGVNRGAAHAGPAGVAASRVRCQHDVVDVAGHGAGIANRYRAGNV